MADEAERGTEAVFEHAHPTDIFPTVDGASRSDSNQRVVLCAVGPDFTQAF